MKIEREMEHVELVETVPFFFCKKCSACSCGHMFWDKNIIGEEWEGIAPFLAAYFLLATGITGFFCVFFTISDIFRWDLPVPRSASRLAPRHRGAACPPPAARHWPGR